jgi:hypothetical protein
MSSKKTNQDESRHAAASSQAASATRPTDGRRAMEAEAQGDVHAMNQAARAVMHPERHDLEWRFYHGAVNG